MKGFILQIILSLAVLLMNTSTPLWASANDYAPTPDQVKAALLYNFAKYVEWPMDYLPGAGDTIVFGIIDGESFGPVLKDIVSGRTVGGKKIVIQQFKTLEDLKPTHLLFIGASAADKLPQIFKVLGRQSVLTVSETKGFVHAGGMISFVARSNKIRFEINAQAVKNADLKISSALITLADRVVEE